MGAKAVMIVAVTELHVTVSSDTADRPPSWTISSRHWLRTQTMKMDFHLKTMTTRLTMRRTSMKTVIMKQKWCSKIHAATLIANTEERGAGAS